MCVVFLVDTAEEDDSEDSTVPLTSKYLHAL